MPRRSPLLTAALAATALATGATGAAARSAPQASAAGSCSVGSGYGYGYSYLTSLRVTDTSCATGRSLAKHHGHVRGWSCHGRRLDTSPVQYDERVTCRSGQRQVVWTYTQNT